MSKKFLEMQAIANVIRYEEMDRLFKQIYQMEKDAHASSPELADGLWWHKHEDRTLTHEEVYCRALDDVMNMIDERLGSLAQ